MSGTHTGRRLGTYNGDEENEDEEERVAGDETQASVDPSFVVCEEDDGAQSERLVHESKHPRWMVTLHANTLNSRKKTHSPSPSSKGPVSSKNIHHLQGLEF